MVKEKKTYIIKKNSNYLKIDDTSKNQSQYIAYNPIYCIADYKILK